MIPTVLMTKMTMVLMLKAMMTLILVPTIHPEVEKRNMTPSLPNPEEQEQPSPTNNW